MMKLLLNIPDVGFIIIAFAQNKMKKN